MFLPRSADLSLIPTQTSYSDKLISHIILKRKISNQLLRALCVRFSHRDRQLYIENIKTNSSKDIKQFWSSVNDSPNAKSIYIYIYVSLCLSVCLFVCLSVCLFVIYRLEDG